MKPEAVIVRVFDPVRGPPQPEANIERTPAPVWFSAATLQKKVFPPLAWVVPGYLPQGLTILAGRPKLGKSWLALDLAAAVARGGYTLGDVKCAPGDVLYAALEDTPRRLQDRMGKVVTGGPWPERLDLLCDLRRADEGGVDLVRSWLEAAKAPRLVIIDTIAKVRPGKGRDEGNYDADYAAVTAWKALADEFEVAVVLIHHVRKMGADDPLEMVSGTNGLTGAADAILILNRDSQGCTLCGRGRDLEEFDRAVQFDRETCRWRALGEASEVRRSDERTEILNQLATAGVDGLTPADVADLAGMPRNNAKQLLFKMAKAGEVSRGARRGSYVHPDHDATTPHNPDNSITALSAPASPGYPVTAVTGGQGPSAAPPKPQEPRPTLIEGA